MDFIEELKWRGMLNQTTPGAEDALRKGSVAGYCGFDPTAPSLQVGNLAAIMLMVHFQRAGHKPIALVGGATGVVGDPSGKSQERNLLSEEDVNYNLNRFKKQLKKFLDFDSSENGAEIVNNHDWFGQMNYLDFLRDVGKHLTISYMMSKDSVQNRLEAGISYTEFSYQLLQGYDFYHLNNAKNCVIQFGGSDQWGNITAGTELIRRMSGNEAHALTAPLVTRADGTKFGKSAAGQKLWLDPEMTSPYEFYQFWMNVEDEMAPQYLKTFTLLSREEIEAVQEDHAAAPHERAMQKKLAEEVTCMVHSRQEYETALKATKILFGKNTGDELMSLTDEQFLSIFRGVPRAEISRDSLNGGAGIIDVLLHCSELYSSKGEIRRDLKGNAVSLNKEKVAGQDVTVRRADLLNDRYLLVQRGKKKYYILEAK
ncbi:MAG: tyrosine--tRNA ligase [Fibrobacterota bacterium]